MMVNSLKQKVSGHRVKAADRIGESLRRCETEIGEIKDRLARIEGDLGATRRTVVTTAMAAPAQVAKAAGKAVSDAGRACEVAGCKAKHMARGLCKNHYYQFKRGSLVKSAGGYEKKV